MKTFVSKLVENVKGVHRIRNIFCLPKLKYETKYGTVPDLM
jgi:hypothetical protein